MLETLINMVLGILMLDNIKIIGVKIGVNKETYFAATELRRDLKLDPNDALTVEIMRLSGIKEVYSFDQILKK